MPLKEEHINGIEELRGQIEEIAVSFLMAPVRNKKPENYVAFTAYEIADETKDRIIGISKQKKDLRLSETADIVGEIELALESILKEQDDEAIYGKKINNPRGYKIKKIEWRGETFYKINLSRMR